jgi:hypothetical protein
MTEPNETAEPTTDRNQLSSDDQTPTNTDELTDSARTFIDDVVQAVSRYATREHSRSVREGLARRQAQDAESGDDHEGPAS